MESLSSPLPLLPVYGAAAQVGASSSAIKGVTNERRKIQHQHHNQQQQQQQQQDHYQNKTDQEQCGLCTGEDASFFNRLESNWKQTESNPTESNRD